MGRVGRFQVMGTLQAARAAALGLDPDEAKSWGLNRAVFYAAAKRGLGRGSTATPTRDRRQKSGAGTKTEARADDEYVLGGEKAYLAGDPASGLRFKMGDEVQTPRDFEWQIQRRFDDWDAAWRETWELIESADQADLNSQHRFYEQVYKPNRDRLAAKWSTPRAATKT